MADLAAFCHFISGKLASVDGPYRDKRGRIVYRLVVAGEHQKWLRSYSAAKKLAERHNAKVYTMARQRAMAAVDELIAERAQELSMQQQNQA